MPINQKSNLSNPLQQRKQRRKSDLPPAPTTELERVLWDAGFSSVVGVDEAGRGPLAGPVVAAALLVPQGFWMEGVNDSKKLSRPKRAALFQSLTKAPLLAYGVGVVDPKTIDAVNIYQATLLAMEQAVKNLSSTPDYLLVDAMDLSHLGLPSAKIIRGDAISFSIAAASIVAKEMRDHLMLQYDEQWPEYGFCRHMGYGTREHRQKLQEYGPCPIHRQSFSLVKELYRS